MSQPASQKNVPPASTIPFISPPLPDSPSEMLGHKRHAQRILREASSATINTGTHPLERLNNVAVDADNDAQMQDGTIATATAVTNNSNDDGNVDANSANPMPIFPTA